MLTFTGKAIRHDNYREPITVEMVPGAARPGLYIDGWSAERCATVAAMVVADRNLSPASKMRFALARVDVTTGRLVANHALAAAIVEALS